MLYTSYLSKLSEMPETMKKFIIMRRPPNISGINIEKVHILAPSDSLRLEFKSNGDWNEFKSAYYKQVSTNPYAIQKINEIVDLLIDEKDVCLICCEKENFRCHRIILADIIIEILSAMTKKEWKWEEFCC